jgi:hypothetical protein
MLKLPRHILSKSTFMYGCQCPKRLWLHKYKPDVRDEMDEEQQAIFQRGTDVGKLAEQLFPGGVDARPKDTFSYQQSVADTAKYIVEGHKVIYEAAFQYEGMLCAVDILLKRRGKWYAYEVKGTTKVKPEHLPDAAFQYYVITNAGLELKDFSIVHLNNQYIRKGPLEINQLFSPKSVLEQIEPLQEFIHAQASALKTMLQNKTEMPKIEVGNHCNKPYACDFQVFCFAGIEEEEPDYGEPNINNEAIVEFLGQLEYPIYHMDFESWMTPVPLYDGHWPFRQVCFQYSVHIEREPGVEPENYAYLAEGTHSSSLEFLESLLSVLGTEGTILVYNKSFEGPRLKELMEEYPQHEEAVEAVLDRIVDLMSPFRKNYRLPEMEGSYSIKHVLPALVPELSYDELTIGNGGDASDAFYNLGKTADEGNVENTRKALLEYCKMDTLAMVKILKILMNVDGINK